MTIKRRKGKFVVEVYDPEIRGARHIGTYETLEFAEQVHAELTRFKPRGCLGCGKRFRPLGERQMRCHSGCGVKRSPLREDAPHWVYRCYRTDGRLLYVGITTPGMRRMKEHDRKATWWSDVDYIRIQHCASRSEALTVESQAIELERPQHNLKSGPKRKAPEPPSVVVDLAARRAASQ